MQGNTHRLGGILFGAATPLVMAPIAKPEHIIPFTGVVMAGAAIGSLIPDIDHEGSLIGRKMKPVAHVVRKTCGHRGLTHTLMALFVYTLVVTMLGSVLVKTTKTTNVEFNAIKSFIEALIMGTSIMFVVHRLKKLIDRHQMTIITVVVFIGSFIFSMIFQNTVMSYIPVYLAGTIVGYFSHLILDMLTVSGVPLLKPFTDHMFRIAKFRTGKVEKQVSAVCVVLTFVCLFFVIK